MRARDNPFRSEKILSLRYRLEGITWPELLARCRQLQNRAALVGPYGSGKTTLLEDLEIKLRGEGFSTCLVRLQEAESEFGQLNKLVSSLRSRDVLLLDGAERLNALRWAWLAWRSRRAGGLILTLHKPGRLPTLWECRTSAALLAELAGQLLSCDPGELKPLAATLFQKHQGNLREALRELYDKMAQGRLEGACR